MSKANKAQKKIKELSAQNARLADELAAEKAKTAALATGVPPGKDKKKDKGKEKEESVKEEDAEAKGTDASLLPPPAPRNPSSTSKSPAGDNEEDDASSSEDEQKSPEFQGAVIKTPKEYSSKERSEAEKVVLDKKDSKLPAFKVSDGIPLTTAIRTTALKFPRYKRLLECHPDIIAKGIMSNSEELYGYFSDSFRDKLDEVTNSKQAWEWVKEADAFLGLGVDSMFSYRQKHEHNILEHISVFSKMFGPVTLAGREKVKAFIKSLTTEAKAKYGDLAAACDDLDEAFGEIRKNVAVNPVVSNSRDNPVIAQVTPNNPNSPNAPRRDFTRSSRGGYGANRDDRGGRGDRGGYDSSRGDRGGYDANRGGRGRGRFRGGSRGGYSNSNQRFRSQPQQQQSDQRTTEGSVCDLHGPGHSTDTCRALKAIVKNHPRLVAAAAIPTSAPSGAQGGTGN